MLFNSLVFIAFFAAVYATYLLLRRQHLVQNRLLLVASYAFYGYWDWRFIPLLIGITLVNFFAGGLIQRSVVPGRRKSVIILAVIANLVILGFFKYFNFFAAGLADLLHLVGMTPGAVTLHIILPLGISFYTFQAMTYPLDIYRGRLAPTNDFFNFALFVAFFPQLLSGPIERALNMLPQFGRPRTISPDRVNAGLYLLLSGFVKKVVIADNVALIADKIFDGYMQFQGFDIIIGILAFTVQIYCDFSGYSDIARGLARLLGFELMVNFKLPYLAANPGDFWRRWHIALTSWFRDYLWWNLVKNTPFGGGIWVTMRWYFSLFFVFLVSGLWHGAAWNFVIWGAYHGLLLVLYAMYDRRWGKRGEVTPYATRSGAGLKIIGTFALVTVGWVIFRATSVGQIAYMLTHIGLTSSDQTGALAYQLGFFSLPLLAAHLWQSSTRDLLAPLRARPWIQIPLYAAGLVAIFVFGLRQSMEFIYFQF